jgi:hypothetical protein
MTRDKRKHKRGFEKFLCALFDAGGELNRTDVSYKLFKKNITKRSLDSLLTSPELNGLFITTRAPRRERIGKKFERDSTRYSLTLRGYNAVLTSRLRQGVVPALSTEAVQAEYERLLAAADSWAVQLDREAHIGRQREEDWLQAKRKADADRKERIRAKAAEKTRLRAEKEEAEARERKAREAREHPNRMPALPTFGVPFGAPPISRPSVVDHPAAPRAFHPRVPVTPVVTPAEDSGSWFQDQVGGMRRHVAMIGAPAASKAAALAERIRKAGYQVNQAGQVLFNSNEWLTPEEWQRRMPGVLD